MFNGESSSPGRVYQEAFPYIFESLWPNDTSRREVAHSIMSFYFTENSKKNANTFVADLTEVRILLYQLTRCLTIMIKTVKLKISSKKIIGC